MKYRIKHITEYGYSMAVSQCYNEAHLTPRNTPFQSVIESKLSIEPGAEDQRDRTDIFGNAVTYFEIHEEHKKLLVTAESEVDLLNDSRGAPPPYSIFEVRQALANSHLEQDLMAQQFLLPSPFIKPDERFAAFAKDVLGDTMPLPTAVTALMEKIFEEFEYDPHFTDMATPLDHVLKHKRGVCQDFAHLAIACLRGLGLPARYVSGYLETVPPPGEKKLEGADESHAWFAVYIPQFGWLDFDPTNNIIPSDKHVTLAWGRDYADVSPLKGIIYGGGNHTLDVSVTVENLDRQQQQQQ